MLLLLLLLLRRLCTEEAGGVQGLGLGQQLVEEASGNCMLPRSDTWMVLSIHLLSTARLQAVPAVMVMREGAGWRPSLYVGKLRVSR